MRGEEQSALCAPAPPPGGLALGLGLGLGLGLAHLPPLRLGVGQVEVMEGDVLHHLLALVHVALGEGRVRVRVRGWG